MEIGSFLEFISDGKIWEDGWMAGWAEFASLQGGARAFQMERTGRVGAQVCAGSEGQLGVAQVSGWSLQLERPVGLAGMKGRKRWGGVGLGGQPGGERVAGSCRPINAEGENRNGVGVGGWGMPLGRPAGEGESQKLVQTQAHNYANMSVEETLRLPHA